MNTYLSDVEDAMNMDIFTSNARSTKKRKQLDNKKRIKGKQKEQRRGTRVSKR